MIGARESQWRRFCETMAPERGELERRGALDITDITQSVPNVTLEASRATNSTLSAFIRGIGVKEDSILVSQPSALTGEAKLIADAPIGVPRDALLVEGVDSASR